MQLSHQTILEFLYYPHYEKKGVRNNMNLRWEMFILVTLAFLLRLLYSNITDSLIEMTLTFSKKITDSSIVLSKNSSVVWSIDH